MGSPAVYISWPSSVIESFDRTFDIQIEEGNSADALGVPDKYNAKPHAYCHSSIIPESPPLPPGGVLIRKLAKGCVVPKETRGVWDKLFEEGYGADVHIVSGDRFIIRAHHCVLSVASYVLENLLQQSKLESGIRYISILGVPYDALRAFIRFLYSSCYEEAEMKKFVLHLLTMSHSYTVPSLKRVCEHFLEKGWLTKENVIDVLQLARSCDAPRLAFVCVRMVVRDFKCISTTEAWKVMRRCNPSLEQELLESAVEADTRRQERLEKTEEKKVYLQLHEAMEAMLHICRDGCRTIGPRDKVLKASQFACGFPACKALETLIRHFSSCKAKVPGGCVHCKRMWQLLELHSRMCNDPEYCVVPLCRHFKVKMQQQSKKEEAKWRVLVSKVMAAKNSQKLFAYRKSSF